MSKMEVIKEFENKLLERKEVTVRLDSTSSTPSRNDVKEQIAKKFKVKADQIIVQNINSRYGNYSTEAQVYIYKSKDAIAKITSEHIQKRNESVAAETPAEEAPVEEKKEEATE